MVAKLERRGEQLQLVCESATTEIASLAAPPRPRRVIHVRVPRSADAWADIRTMQRLDEILRHHEGDDDVVLHVPVGTETVSLRSRTRRIEWGDAARAELEALLGAGAAMLEDPGVAVGEPPHLLLAS
ncbi:MAG: hypothetical protein AVDCRST_MAG49-1416 [uncultured Thermomicrobiales bacterium]|uniref:Uncharacterized protein n=1 Tax=uncultured Thermomicrobiales bacterium TaxID=1645740 RepID=A0A6J4UCZ9_9BACT|nr:MAG: hypothetical protein AVDCRST_MAG49-1416 [uncultured Thermomicrobiales bacterium]